MTEITSLIKEPICPLMSGAPVPVEPPANHVVQPGRTFVGAMQVECVKEKCRLWHDHYEDCKLGGPGVDKISLAKIADSLEDIRIVLTPPESGSPLLHISKTLDKMLEFWKSFLQLKKKG